MPKTSDAMDAILKALDEATEPKKMSKVEALDFLNELDAALEGRREALRDEIADDE